MKPYLVFMAGPDSIEDLKAMIEPIKDHIRGICAMLHDCDYLDDESEYLVKVNHQLGAGNIIYGKFTSRHDHSRNRILYETGMKNGDYFIQTDVLEHPKAEFLKNVPLTIERNSRLGCLYYYGKPFLVKYNDDLVYVGNPHESLLKIDGFSMEYSQAEPNEANVRQNMRPIKRANEPFHWVKHYFKYYLYPSSNQCLLGLDKLPDREAIFYRRKDIQNQFIKHLENLGIDRDADEVINYWNNGGWDDTFADLISKEKILSDIYRYCIVGDRDMIDNHDLSAVKNFKK